ncbi:MAG: hypothetical protein CMO47_09480 [Verrucomicrobiales bacterium]|nr:hypothetical protein [Verrucomicrobiales bacterium]
MPPYLTVHLLEFSTFTKLPTSGLRRKPRTKSMMKIGAFTRLAFFRVADSSNTLKNPYYADDTVCRLKSRSYNKFPSNSS